MGMSGAISGAVVKEPKALAAVAPLPAGLTGARVGKIIVGAAAVVVSAPGGAVTKAVGGEE